MPNSTSPPVSRLVRHNRWAYDDGGARGVGFSEPEAIDAPPLPAFMRLVAQTCTATAHLGMAGLVMGLARREG